MTWLIIISLIIVGLLFLILEILVIPGVIVGIIGALMVVFGIVLGYRSGITEGNLTLAGTLLTTVILLIMVFRSKTWNRLMLNNQNKSRVNELEENAVHVGDILLTVSKLRPMGKARLNNEHYEVTSISNYINENIEVIVVKIDGNKIYVKTKEEK